jgi:hypothetical protein
MFLCSLFTQTALTAALQLSGLVLIFVVSGKLRMATFLWMPLSQILLHHKIEQILGRSGVFLETYYITVISSIATVLYGQIIKRQISMFRFNSTGYFGFGLKCALWLGAALLSGFISLMFAVLVRISLLETMK